MVIIPDPPTLKVWKLKVPVLGLPQEILERYVIDPETFCGPSVGSIVHCGSYSFNRQMESYNDSIDALLVSTLFNPLLIVTVRRNAPAEWRALQLPACMAAPMMPASLRRAAGAISARARRWGPNSPNLLEIPPPITNREGENNPSRWAR